MDVEHWYCFASNYKNVFNSPPPCPVLKSTWVLPYLNLTDVQFYQNVCFIICFVGHPSNEIITCYEIIQTGLEKGGALKKKPR